MAKIGEKLWKIYKKSPVNGAFKGVFPVGAEPIGVFTFSWGVPASFPLPGGWRRRIYR